MWNMEWYDLLVKPSLTPPAGVFTVVWPVLYTMMAVSLLLVLRAPSNEAKTTAIRCFFAQLFFNLLWSPVFFAFKSPLLALLVLIALLIFLFRTVFLFYKQSKTASFLRLPYVFWGMFALYLNTGIIVLN